MSLRKSINHRQPIQKQQRQSSNTTLATQGERTIQNLRDVKSMITTNRDYVTQDPAERDSLEKDELKVLTGILSLYDSEDRSRGATEKKALQYMDNNIEFQDPFGIVRGKDAYTKQYALLKRIVKRFELDPYQVSFLHDHPHQREITDPSHPIHSRMILDCTTYWSFLFTTLRIRQEIICKYYAYPSSRRNPVITYHEDMFSFTNILSGIPILGWLYYYFRIAMGKTMSSVSAKFPQDKPSNPALEEHEGLHQFDDSKKFK